MAMWAEYLLVISAITSLAALSLERAVRPYGLATRWIWLCALCGSLALPLILSATRGQPEITGAQIHAVAVAGQTAHASAAIARPEWSTPPPASLIGSPPERLDGPLAAVWIASSLIAAAVLFGGSWYAHRRRRGWRRVAIGDTEVLVAKDAGPATVGLLHPRIVVPEWLLTAAPETLRLVIAHERSHIEARDPGLWGIGLGVAALMPWNPLLCWQVHRLRLAIEVDCDRRVLRFGHDARRYARTLVDVSTRRPAYLGALAASARSLSSIERRIIIMSTPRIRGWRATTAASALLFVGSATALILISPPAIPPALAAIPAAPEPTGLGGYVGSYETSAIEVLRIELRNGQLIAQSPGMRPQPLTRTSGEEFRFGNSNAHVRFATDSEGHVTGLVFQQNGAATEAPRVGAVRVHAIDSAIEARVRAQKPMPGSEVALRELIVGIVSGTPRYADLSPQLAAGTRALLPKLQSLIKPLGALRSLEFRGVDRNGWDRYLVRFQKGTASCGIALDSYGVAIGAMIFGTHPHSNS